MSASPSASQSASLQPPPPPGNRQAVRDILAPLRDRRIADIGCGDGTWTRFLTGEGAHVIGLDPNPRVIQRAQAAAPVGDETYIQASAAALPLEDGSQDIALFFNSLHHIPPDLMVPALTEAARITHGGGLVVAFEPVARGANYLLNRPVDDEAEVRAAAHHALQTVAAQDPRLHLDREEEYITASRRADFAAWRDWHETINADRIARFAADGDALKAHFDRVVSDCPRDPEGFILLEQPMRFTILSRKAVESETGSD